MISQNEAWAMADALWGRGRISRIIDFRTSSMTAGVRAFEIVLKGGEKHALDFEGVPTCHDECISMHKALADRYNAGIVPILDRFLYVLVREVLPFGALEKAYERAQQDETMPMEFSVGEYVRALALRLKPPDSGS